MRPNNYEDPRLQAPTRPPLLYNDSFIPRVTLCAAIAATCNIMMRTIFHQVNWLRCLALIVILGALILFYQSALRALSDPIFSRLSV
jgi:hypothetical protein